MSHAADLPIGFLHGMEKVIDLIGDSVINSIKYTKEKVTDIIEIVPKIEEGSEKVAEKVAENMLSLFLSPEKLEQAINIAFQNEQLKHQFEPGVLEIIKNEILSFTTVDKLKEIGYAGIESYKNPLSLEKFVFEQIDNFVPSLMRKFKEKDIPFPFENVDEFIAMFKEKLMKRIKTEMPELIMEKLELGAINTAVKAFYAIPGYSALSTAGESAVEGVQSVMLKATGDLAGTMANMLAKPSKKSLTGGGDKQKKAKYQNIIRRIHYSIHAFRNTKSTTNAHNKTKRSTFGKSTFGKSTFGKSTFGKG